MDSIKYIPPSQRLNCKLVNLSFIGKGLLCSLLYRLTWIKCLLPQTSRTLFSVRIWILCVFQKQKTVCPCNILVQLLKLKILYFWTCFSSYCDPHKSGTTWTTLTTINKTKVKRLNQREVNSFFIHILVMLLILKVAQTL